jgi:hypothetical protein
MPDPDHAARCGAEEVTGDAWNAGAVTIVMVVSVFTGIMVLLTVFTRDSRNGGTPSRGRCR